MQRRAAAVSAVIFLVLAAGAFALIGAAQQPAVDIPAQYRDYTLQANQTFTAGGIQYDVTSLSDGSAEASWTNESARFTASLQNNSTVAYRGGNYTVLIPNESQPSQFQLREVQTVDRPTVTQNGTTYVVVERNGTKTLVPRDEYLPAPQTYEFQQGDQLEYGNNSTTVASISPQAATLAWSGVKVNTVSFEEGSNVTLGSGQGTEYVATFPDANTMVLSSNYQPYKQDIDAQDYYVERMDGLWVVVILGLVGAAMLVAMGYLPSRY